MSEDVLPPGARIANTINDSIAAGLTETADAVIETVTRNLNTPLMNRRFLELQAEADRLAELGQRLDPQNPVLRTFLADLENALDRNARAIGQAGEPLQTAAINNAGDMAQQMTLPGINPEFLARVGYTWNRPNPQAINQAIGFMQSAAFADEIARYPGLVLQTVRNQAIMGFVNGWSPIRVATQIAAMTENVPVAQAQTIMRTLYLQSFRSAGVIHREANAPILSHHIRIAALDDRVCLACIALHGTTLRLNERVNDHHNGRCTSVNVVRGFTPPVVTTGEDWLVGLPVERQRRIMGAANYEAFQSGAVTLRDFVRPYDDAIYGEMLNENSLVGILGNDANRFYSR